MPGQVRTRSGAEALRQRAAPGRAAWGRGRAGARQTLDGLTDGLTDGQTDGTERRRSSFIPREPKKVFKTLRGHVMVTFAS